MKAELQDVVAPLGLGFEMPEKVWAVNTHGTNYSAHEIGSEVFVNVWATKDDAILAAYRGDRELQGNPRCFAYETLRTAFRRLGWRKKQAVHGARLLDSKWNEIGRRYFR